MDNDTLPDWGRIVDTLAERVLRVALRILGNAQDAEDASQEAFAEAFRFQQRGRVQSWTGLLIRLATLRSLDMLRRRRHSQGLREEDWVSREGTFENAAAQELAQRLRHAVSRLPEQQAAVYDELLSNNYLARRSAPAWEYRLRRQPPPSTRRASNCRNNWRPFIKEIHDDAHTLNERSGAPRSPAGCRRRRRAVRSSPGSIGSTRPGTGRPAVPNRGCVRTREVRGTSAAAHSS